MLGGVAMGKPTRSVLGASGSNGGAAAGWTNPYVTDGLVAMWDGEWNAGGGVHDATSTIWKDLVGNADLKCETSSVSDSWIRYSQSVQITLENALITDYPFTVQGVYDRTETTGNFCAFGFGFSTSRLCTGSASTFGCRFSSTYNTKNVVGPRNAITWLRSSADGDKMRIFADGNDLGLTTSPQGGGVSTLAKICINGENPYGNYRNVFSVGNIRVYNRALSAAEIAVNYAVDKARFGLP